MLSALVSVVREIYAPISLGELETGRIEEGSSVVAPMDALVVPWEYPGTANRNNATIVEGTKQRCFKSTFIIGGHFRR